MYILDAFWSIIPGNEAKAYAALGALAAQVEKEEPDTWMYLLHTPNLDPGVNTFPMPGPQQVAFVEGFKDRDAYHKHAKSPILKHADLGLVTDLHALLPHLESALRA